MEVYGKKWKSIITFAGNIGQTHKMASFIGEYTVKVDDRGRLVLPSAFKAALGESADTRLVVKSALFTDCLEVKTYAEWEEEASCMRGRLNPYNREHDRLWRAFMADTTIVEPDGKIGRILIPKHLLSKIGAAPGKETVFSGCGHKIEIWDKGRFEAQRMPADEFVALTERILG